MTDKSKFKFANEINDDFEIENEEDFKPVEIELTDEQKREKGLLDLKNQAKSKRIRLLKTIGVMAVITGILLFLAMLWQDSWSLMAFGDALWLVFMLEFFAGWTLFIYNLNIWSPLTYGTKTFVMMFLGKRPKVKYYEYMVNVQDNQIPSYYYWVFFISAFIVFIPALITLLILT